LFFPDIISGNDASKVQAVNKSSMGAPFDPDITMTTEEYERRLKDLNNNSQDSDFLYELGFLAIVHNDLDSAENYFNLAEEHNNYTVPFYKTYVNYHLASIFEKRGDLVKALDYYIKYNDAYYIHVIQGKIYEQNDEIEKAEKEYLMASEFILFDMYNTEPYLILARMFFNHKDFEKSEFYVRELFRYIGESRILEGGSLSFPVDDEIDKGYEILRNIKAIKK
jgi:tetratricopeptide (TPR) repeat protein